MISVPGAWDAVSAQLIEQAGYDAVYMSGGITSMTHGYPDFGLLDMGEMVANAGRMARSVRVPLIADADTGYGNELNVTRTVREYEMRGVAAIHIEDQVAPKRCGHLDGKEIVSRAELVSKIRAALEARKSRDFLIIARTDSRAVMGLDEAVARANAALEAGADVAFVEAMQTMEEVAAIPLLVRGLPVHNPELAFATPDHAVSSQPGRTGTTYPEGSSTPFTLDASRREMLLHGLDDIALTLKDDTLIRSWQEVDRSRRPWSWSAGASAP